MPKTGEITWDAFVEQLEKDGCSKQGNRKKGMFLGGDDPTAYPHIHLWDNETVALSLSHNTNPKIGDDDNIDLEKLYFAYDRVKDWSAALPLQKAIETVLSDEFVVEQ